MLYVKIKLLYTTNRNWKPFCNILNQLRYFPVQTWYEKTRIFTSFQLQTALESRNQHQMTWNLAFLSTFMSSTRKNHPKSVNRKSPFFKVKVPFFFILPHSALCTYVKAMLLVLSAAHELFFNQWFIMPDESEARKFPTMMNERKTWKITTICI